MEDQWLSVGKLVNTHGIKGEVKIVSQTDFPEERFAPDVVLTLLQPETKQTIKVEVQSARLHKNMYVVKFKGYDNINEVEKLKGWELKVTKDELVPLEDGEYYHHQIVGCKVVTDEGVELGVITEILCPGANDVWVVQQQKGKHVLIPVIDDVILDVNIQSRIITVHLLEGLI